MGMALSEKEARRLSGLGGPEMAIGIGPKGAKTCKKGDWAIDYTAPLYVTAPRTAEQSISLISAGVSALDGVAMTDDEKERVWALVNKAMERLK